MSTNIRGRRGFTLIELLVIIAVIGILAATTAIGMAIYQSQARDAQRAAGASVIVEGLERYYLANGEYPGCELLSGNINTVGDMLGINPEALTAPGAEKGTNSLRCEVAEGDEAAVYLYTGDASSTCAEGPACLHWTIEYTKESDNSVVAQDSRHRVSVDTAGVPLLNGAAESSTEVALSWTQVMNAQSYNLQYSRASSFSNSQMEATSQQEISIGDLTQGAIYYFRVNAVTGTGTSGWSNVRSITLPIDDPDDPIVTASLSGTTVTGSSSVIACPDETTAEYRLRYRRTASDNDGSWSSYNSWSTGRVYTITNAAQGYEYTFQAEARCRGSNNTSSASQSGTDTVVVPIAIPGSATVSASLSGSTATGTLAAISCPSGTTAEYRMRTRTSVDSANLGTWSSYDTWNSQRTRSVSVGPGYRAGFQGQVRCYSAQDTSDARSSNEASVVRAFSTPAAPSVSVSVSGSTATATVSAVSCESGSSPQYQLRTRHSNTSSNLGTYSGWTSWSTSRSRSDSISQGYRRGYQAQVRCVGDFNTSGVRASSEGAGVRGIGQPAMPVYTGDTTWEAGYRYRMTYSTSCPSGTGVHSEKPQLYNTGFSGNYRYPRSGYYQIPTDELWWLGWNNNQTYEDVYYYARYRCSTSFATSPYSSNRTTKIDVRCAPHRRTFNTYPRCDTYGQDWQAMPYGP